MQGSGERDPYGPCALHSDSIELPARGRLEEAEVFFLLVGSFSFVALRGLIWELKP